MKTLSIRQQIKLAPKYVLFIEGAGYLANKQGLTGINFTNNINNAEMFAVGFDNVDVKAGIWNAAAKRMFNNSAVQFEVKYL